MVINKTFYTLILAISFTSCENINSSQEKSEELSSKQEIKSNVINNDLLKMSLKGKVKVLKQEEFYIGNSDAEIGYKTGENSYSYEFDTYGNKTYEQYYDNNGMIKEVSKFVYSQNGKKTGKRIIDINNKLIHSYDYIYNELGQIVKYNVIEFEKNDKFQFYSISKYDESGNEILSSKYTPNGEKVQTSKYYYVNNKKIKLILLDNLDSPYAICEYKYNEEGDVNKERYFTGNEQIFEEYSIKYIYDDHKNWIKKIYILDKKQMNSISNKDKKTGAQTITMRTINYY